MDTPLLDCLDTPLDSLTTPPGAAYDYHERPCSTDSGKASTAYSLTDSCWGHGVTDQAGKECPADGADIACTEHTPTSGENIACSSEHGRPGEVSDDHSASVRRGGGVGGGGHVTGNGSGTGLNSATVLNRIANSCLLLNALKMREEALVDSGPHPGRTTTSPSSCTSTSGSASTPSSGGKHPDTSISDPADANGHVGESSNGAGVTQSRKSRDKVSGSGGGLLSSSGAGATHICERPPPPAYPGHAPSTTAHASNPSSHAPLTMTRNIAGQIITPTKDLPLHAQNKKLVVVIKVKGLTR